MLKKTPLMIALVLAVLFSGLVPGGAKAGPTALVWFVHGISGLDVGQTTMQYPVDVWVEGVGCVLKNFMFMNTAGPFALPSGNFNVLYSPANIANPCSQAAVLSAPLYLIDNGAYTVIAHLSEGGGATVSTTRNIVTRTTNQNGKSRFTFVNAAASGPIDVFARPHLRQSILVANDLANGQSVIFSAKAGKWKYWFTDASSTYVLHGPMLLQTRTANAYFFFLVGSAANGYYTASYSVNTRLIMPSPINWVPLP
jgi:hypothetical protein